MTEKAADHAQGIPSQGGIWERPTSLWEATAPPPPALPVQQDSVKADLLVIGGGFTGLSAGLHAAEAGKRVVVLEASELGRGASGRNNGQVIPTLTRPDPADLVARFGWEAGERFVGLIRDSASTLFDLVRRLGIDCAAEQTGWVQPVHSPGRIRIAERRAKQWGQYGADVELLDRAAVSAILGTDAYFGGWINRTGGHINPLALVRGLAAKAAAAGAAIYVNSPALSVERRGDSWVARTPQGMVTADALVLGTNGYAAAVFPQIRTEVVPVLSWQMATAPLGDNVRKTVLPGRQAMSDTHGDLRFMRYNRRKPAGDRRRAAEPGERGGAIEAHRRHPSGRHVPGAERGDVRLCVEWPHRHDHRLLPPRPQAGTERLRLGRLQRARRGAVGLAGARTGAGGRRPGPEGPRPALH